MTTAVVGGTITRMDDLEQQYKAPVERIGGYPMSKAARAGILAEIEKAYRRERAATAAATSGLAPNG